MTLIDSPCNMDSATTGIGLNGAGDSSAFHLESTLEYLLHLGLRLEYWQNAGNFSNGLHLESGIRAECWQCFWRISFILVEFRVKFCWNNLEHQQNIANFLPDCREFIYLFSDLAQVLGIGQKDMKYPTRSIHLEPSQDKIYPSPVTP